MGPHPEPRLIICSSRLCPHGHQLCPRASASFPKQHCKDFAKFAFVLSLVGGTALLSCPMAAVGDTGLTLF